MTDPPTHHHQIGIDDANRIITRTAAQFLPWPPTANEVLLTIMKSVSDDDEQQQQQPATGKSEAAIEGERAGLPTDRATMLRVLATAYLEQVLKKQQQQQAPPNNTHQDELQEEERRINKGHEGEQQQGKERLDTFFFVEQVIKKTQGR